MKKNLKIMLPTLLVVLVAQFLLVRQFVNKGNDEITNQSDVDTRLPAPSSRYEPKEVVQVLLYSLRNNDLPNKDSGSQTFWQFSTSRLKRQLRDKALVRPYLGEDLWKALTDFDSYKVTYSKIQDKDAVFEVELISSKRLTRQFVIAVSLVGELWMVDQMVKRI